MSNYGIKAPMSLVERVVVTSHRRATFTQVSLFMNMETMHWVLSESSYLPPDICDGNSIIWLCSLVKVHHSLSTTTTAIAWMWLNMTRCICILLLWLVWSSRFNDNDGYVHYRNQLLLYWSCLSSWRKDWVAAESVHRTATSDVKRMIYISWF